MNCDLLILGSGPGGFRAALDAAHAGLSAILVEKGPLGGTCLNWGCIPTKLFLGATHPIAELQAQKRMRIATGQITIDLAALQRRKKTIVQSSHKAMRTRLQKSGVHILSGTGTLTAPDTLRVYGESASETIRFQGMILAAGTVPSMIPGLPVDGKIICTSDHLLDCQEIPERLAVIGAGAIGIELAQFWARMGSQITMVEMAPRVAPTEDPEISKILASAFKRQGWKLHPGTKVEKVHLEQDSATLTLSSGKEVVADKILVAAGRRPETAELGLEEAGIETSGPGWISTDPYLRATDQIYAVGDVNGRFLLAHAAEDQAAFAIKHFLGKIKNPYPDPPPPSCIYGTPEVFRAGKTEKDFSESRSEAAISTYHLVGNPICHAHAVTQGLIKVLWNKGRVAGITGVGHGVSSLVTMAEIIVKQKWDKTKVLEYVFAHPSLDEALKEALLAPAERLDHD
ncbi:MAG: dihydrolipoyl dehydrogenase family protein [Desulfovibrionales bacterium]